MFCLQLDIKCTKLTSLFKCNKFSSLLHLISGWNKESYTHHICATDYRSFKVLKQISMSSCLTLDESDSTLSHDLALQWPQVPQPTEDGPEPMRWIVNPPSSAFCDLPPGPPGQTKTSQGVEKTALIVKRSIVVPTGDAALLYVCAWLWQKQWSRNNNCSRNHNRTPNRHLLIRSHCKTSENVSSPFLLYPDMWTLPKIQQINSTIFNQCLFLGKASMEKKRFPSGIARIT